ncbi:MAG: MFS transporter [Anaerolineales bacterium]|nr:MAG: MFS transporter [Anaerolineales bacterium]
MRSKSNYRWFVVVVFFFFMLLHQADKLLIGPMTTPIMETFDIDEVQMGAVFTGALLVGAILYPIWGYLYDRYARAKLLALASLIWGTTTWISAVAPTYPFFLASRASTGVDDSSYPGLFSLIADYFSPAVRGKIYGILQLTQPLGYMLGLILAMIMSSLIGWRGIYYLTGSLGILLAFIIFFGIREAPRGRSEPELANIEHIGIYRFNKKIALDLFKKRSLLFLFAQGFIGVFPWNVITYWFFRYLETERNFSSEALLTTMAPTIVILAIGYFLGGAIGDYFFRRSLRGRMAVSLTGVLTGAILLSITMSVPVGNQSQFSVMLFFTALFIPFSSANVIATVYDITLPEVRSTALAVQYFIENGGAALAPLIAGIIARATNLHTAILTICVAAWLIASLLLAFTAVYVPKDIQTLRDQLHERAEIEMASSSA